MTTDAEIPRKVSNYVLLGIKKGSGNVLFQPHYPDWWTYRVVNECSLEDWLASDPWGKRQR